MIKKLTFLAFVTLVTLSGCQNSNSANTETISSTPSRAVCNPEGLQQFIGLAPMENVVEQIRLESGAMTVRVIRYDQPVTLEYNPERVNIVTDAAGMITSINCG